MADMQGFTQWPTYPQLLVNGELLGGCDIVMEMQQDGSLKTAVQEALGAQLDIKTALQQRIKQLLDSSPVVLFMKVPSSCTICMQPCNLLKPVIGRTQARGISVHNWLQKLYCVEKAFGSRGITRSKQWLILFAQIWLAYADPPTNLACACVNRT